MMRMSNGGVVLENHEITAINTKMGEQGFYKQEINKIMRTAANLTYTDPSGVTYKGFTNILQAQRRGMIPSEVLDSGKFAQIFSLLREAYSKAKRVAEDNLPLDIKAPIREREYALKRNTYNQKAGYLDQVLEDSGLQETLNMAK